MSRHRLSGYATPEYIWKYYERSQVGLEALRREATDGPSALGPFARMTVPQFEEALREMRDELDRQVTLALVANFEGLIRVDYRDRATRRLKGAASRRLRTLYRKHGDRAALDNILDVWKGCVGRPERIGRFKQLLGLRHWLAHGRYWVQKSGIQPDPHLAWGIADVLFRSLPGFGSLSAA